MPCGSESYYERFYQKPEKLAEKGLNPTEIAELQAKVTLAVEKAKAQAFTNGVTFEQQRVLMQVAVKAAVKEWHLEQHARLQADMNLIIALGRMHAPEKVR